VPVRELLCVDQRCLVRLPRDCVEDLLEVLRLRGDAYDGQVVPQDRDSGLAAALRGSRGLRDLVDVQRLRALYQREVIDPERPRRLEQPEGHDQPRGVLAHLERVRVALPVLRADRLREVQEGDVVAEAVVLVHRHVAVPVHAFVRHNVLRLRPHGDRVRRAALEVLNRPRTRTHRPLARLRLDGHPQTPLPRVRHLIVEGTARVQRQVQRPPFEAAVVDEGDGLSEAERRGKNRRESKAEKHGRPPLGQIVWEFIGGRSAPSRGTRGVSEAWDH
jgi:hypothetical protein